MRRLDMGLLLTRMKRLGNVVLNFNIQFYKLRLQLLMLLIILGIVISLGRLELIRKRQILRVFLNLLQSHLPADGHDRLPIVDKRFYADFRLQGVNACCATLLIPSCVILHLYYQVLRFQSDVFGQSHSFSRCREVVDSISNHQLRYSRLFILIGRRRQSFELVKPILTNFGPFKPALRPKNGLLLLKQIRNLVRQFSILLAHFIQILIGIDFVNHRGLSIDFFFVNCGRYLVMAYP